MDIGAFEASSSYLVTNTADSLDVGTLRAAVGWANVSTNANPANIACPAPNTVIFDTAGTFATPQTIILTRDPGAEQHDHGGVDRRHWRGEPDRGPQQHRGDVRFRHFHHG